ncbi:MAG: hypothetical protein OWU84_08875 [Firmicutes bacterium]|nr:hypothetical protein [Bacillota bacterium]
MLDAKATVSHALRAWIGIWRWWPGSGSRVNVYPLFAAITTGTAVGVALPATVGGLTAHGLTLLGRLLTNFVVALIVVTLFPAGVKACTDQLSQNPFRLAAVGACGWLAWALLVTVLAVLIVGLPVAAALTLFGLVVALLANAIAIQWVGLSLVARIRSQRLQDPYAALAVGALAVTLGEMVPLVGALVRALTLVVGLGALLVTRLQAVSERWP